MQQLLGAHVLAMPQVHASILLGRGFFPGLIAQPFATGLHTAFLVAAGLCFFGAVLSWLRGTSERGAAHSLRAETEEGLAAVGAVAMIEAGAGSLEALSEST